MGFSRSRIHPGSIIAERRWSCLVLQWLWFLMEDCKRIPVISHHRPWLVSKTALWGKASVGSLASPGQCDTGSVCAESIFCAGGAGGLLGGGNLPVASDVMDLCYYCFSTTKSLDGLEIWKMFLFQVCIHVWVYIDLWSDRCRSYPTAASWNFALTQLQDATLRHLVGFSNSLARFCAFLVAFLPTVFSHNTNGLVQDVDLQRVLLVNPQEPWVFTENEMKIA